MVWSDDGVRELASKFVPAADEVNVILWQRGPEQAALFRKIGEQGHYGKPWQGIYAATPVDGQGLVTLTEHGAPFVAAVERGCLAATQFHPEKSGDVGAQLLKNWLTTIGGGATG